MFLHKLAIGLGSLVIVHPAVKLFGFNWEQPTVDIDVITAAEDDEMSANVYRNGVLFGVWVAGVAISMGRLLSYAIYGGGAAKKGIDVNTQTELETKEEPTSQASEVEEVKEIKVVNQESYTKFTAVKQEVNHELIKVEELGSPSNNEETMPIEEVSKEGKGEGSKIEPKLDEKEDKEVKSETKISVYKLPAIKRHHFMILQDGMKTLRQSVQGKFSFEKITLDGVRNFIFIVAKGTPSQLSELESKVKADFRWLTPVRDPSAKLTGVRAPPTIQEPKWASSSSVNNSASRIPAPRTTISPRARSPGPRAGLPHKSPNPNTKTPN